RRPGRGVGRREGTAARRQRDTRGRRIRGILGGDGPEGTSSRPGRAEREGALMLRAADFQGRVLALPPTPMRTDVDPLGPESTVDLDESCRLADQLIRDGVGLIGLCGTTGEGATTTWSERVEMYDAV